MPVMTGRRNAKARAVRAAGPAGRRPRLAAPKIVEHVTKRGIVYSDRGEGQAVVLLHGWCMNKRLWMYQEEHLASRARVIVPDLPGFGASSNLSGPYELDRYVDELDAFLKELALHDVVLCGFAFGACVAMGLAARGSTRIKGIVVITIPSTVNLPFDRMPRSMRRDFPEFARRSARVICKQPQSEATLAWIESMYASTSLPVAIATAELLARFDGLPLSASIEVPTLVIQGAQDDFLPVSVSEACVRAMRRGRLEVVQDCGHLVLIDQKDRTSELLDGFLGELAERKSVGAGRAAR